jgi:hypothetical protein
VELNKILVPLWRLRTSYNSCVLDAAGIHCELCGRWCHYSCGNVKAQIAGREKWSCARCKADRFRKLQEDLQNALRQIDEMKARNRELEEKLLLVGAGKRDTVPAKQKSAKCMVVGDSVVRGVGAEHTDMIVECFPGIRTEHLHNVIDVQVPTCNPQKYPYTESSCITNFLLLDLHLERRCIQNILSRVLVSPCLIMTGFGLQDWIK